jgi:hypothetical protein
MEGDAMKRLLRAGWYIAATAAFCLLSMSIGFAAVRAMSDDEQEPTHSESAQQSWRLKTYAQGLVNLTAEFSERARRAESGQDETLDLWINQYFFPRLEHIRNEIREASLPEADAAVLLHAAQSAEQMATNPRDASLRMRATDVVLEASAVIEAQLAPDNPDAD